MRKRNEQIFTTQLLKWIRAKNFISDSCAIEVKVTETNTIPFSAVKMHQVLALQQVKGGQLAIKLTDDSMGKKPFDLFVLKKAKASLVLAFITPRKNTRFWVIDIDLWDEARLAGIKSKKKSLTVLDLETYSWMHPQLCRGYEIASLHSR